MVVPAACQSASICVGWLQAVHACGGAVLRWSWRPNCRAVGRALWPRSDSPRADRTNCDRVLWRTLHSFAEFAAKPQQSLQRKQRSNHKSDNGLNRRKRNRTNQLRPCSAAAVGGGGSAPIPKPALTRALAPPPPPLFFCSVLVLPNPALRASLPARGSECACNRRVICTR
jgi:hypothetical protein